MATSAPPSPSKSTSSTPQKSFYARHEFLIRRLHSLTGLVPVGVFLFFHLTTNFTVWVSHDFFQQNVDLIHGTLDGLLVPVEWAFIFLPLLFHGIIGLWLAAEGQSNTGHYRYVSNWRYVLQRVTGVLAFFFIIWHVAHMHKLGSYLNPLFGGKEIIGGQFEPHHHAASTAAAAVGPLWVRLLYALGMFSAVFHLANGIWTAGITWGLWITPAAQRRANYLAVALGLLLAGFGAMSLVALSDPELAKKGNEILQKKAQGKLALEEESESETVPQEPETESATAADPNSDGQG